MRNSFLLSSFPPPFSLPPLPSLSPLTIEEKWRQQSEAAKQEAEKLPYGKERDHLFRRPGSLRLHLVSTTGCRHRL